MASMFRLGLTGGIGSGKSTVAGFLAASGAALVDADAISRTLTAPGGLAMPSIEATFGASFVTPTGALDRDKMRTLAHTDTAARKKLEAIIHPLVAQETQRQVAQATREARRCIVFDIPLLVESRTWRQKLDHVLVVDCTPDVQISRVMARSHLTHRNITQIMSSQAGRAQRLGAADTVIFNEGLSLEGLADEVHQILPLLGLS